MLTSAARSSLRFSKYTTPRALASRSFTIADSLKSKEKVEEERYMREQEKKFIATKKAAMAEKMHAEEEARFAEAIAPCMAEAEIMLKKSGDSVSNAGLEALARWKLGL